MRIIAIFFLAQAGLPPLGHAQDYQIPFAPGEKVLVSQAFGGKASHLESGSFHSVDFSVPEDTEIYAARGGTVLAVEESHAEADFDPAFMEKGNRVIVSHGDGTLAIYAHLKWRGAKVKKGQRVATGDKIGLSGNTGFSSGPHLHFAVVREVASGLAPTVPYTFVTEEGPGKLLEPGKSYARPEP